MLQPPEKTTHASRSRLQQRREKEAKSAGLHADRLQRGTHPGREGIALTPRDQAKRLGQAMEHAAEQRLEGTALGRKPERGEVVGAHPPSLTPAIPDDWSERPARVRPRRMPSAQGSAAERLRSVQAPRTGSGTRLVATEPLEAARAIWQYLAQEGLAEIEPTPVASSRTVESPGSR